MRAVIGMAHEKGLKLVAEGIEMEEELGEMKVERIDHIQGYYYSRSVSMDEFMNFIRRKNESSNKTGYY